MIELWIRNYLHGHLFLWCIIQSDTPWESNLLIPERRELSSVLCCGKSYQTLSHDRDQRPERPGKQGPARKPTGQIPSVYCPCVLQSVLGSGLWRQCLLVLRISPLCSSPTLSPFPLPYLSLPAFIPHSVPHAPSPLFSPSSLSLCISFPLIHALSLSFPMYGCRFLKTGSRTAKDYAKLDF